MFTEIIQKIDLNDISLDAKANGLFLKSIFHERYEINEMGEKGACIEKEQYYCLNNFVLLVNETIGQLSVIKLQNSQGQNPVVNYRIEFKKSNRKEYNWCIIKLSGQKGAQLKLTFKTDLEYRIISLFTSSGGGPGIAKKYFRFYEEFDENGNWTRMRETIGEKTHLVERKLNYYKKEFFKDNPPTEIRKYLTGLPYPKLYKPLGVGKGIKGYYWVEGNMIENQPPYTIDFLEIQPELFRRKYVTILTKDGSIVEEENVECVFVEDPADVSQWSSAWLITNQEEEVYPILLSTPSVKLPNLEAYYEMFYYPWFFYLIKPYLLDYRTKKVEEYESICRFWVEMERLEPERYLCERGSAFCLVSNRKEEIDRFIKDCPRDIEYKRGFHKF